MVIEKKNNRNLIDKWKCERKRGESLKGSFKNKCVDLVPRYVPMIL